MTQPQIDTVIASWKTKLLDLSKRNRAINFKPTRASTVEVADISSVDLFAQLTSGKASFRFRATARDPKDPVADAGQEFALDFDVDEAENAAEAELASYLSDETGGKMRSGFLNVPLTPARADLNLRRIEQLARLSIEEQGINTLHLAFGFIEYYESEQSDIALRAPLILAPVELKRRTDAAGFSMKASDDDPIANPALQEFMRVSFGITLPALPDFDSDAPFDLSAYFGAVEKAISAHPRWSVVDAVFLGLFSFQKLVMYKDLERGAAAIAEHPAIQQIVLRAGAMQRNLPDDIQNLDLDAALPPEHQSHVVDADSSQLRALAAVDRGHNLIVIGPPGTGKSQTITNMIASIMVAGKSVLFVAEKQAALDVVYDRLRECGLASFCLPLHSTNANKKAVLKHVETAWDLAVNREPESSLSSDQLPEVRESLNAYASALRTPFGNAGYSPFDAYGEYGRHTNSPAHWLSIDAATLTRGDIEKAAVALDEVAAAASGIGVPTEHPWRQSTLDTFGAERLDQIARHCGVALGGLAKIDELAATIQTRLAFPAITSLAGARAAVAVAALMKRSPGAPLSVLENNAWTEPPPDAVEIVKRGRAISELTAFQQSRFTPAVLDIEHGLDILAMEGMRTGAKKYVAWIEPTYWRIKKRWQGYVAAGSASLADIAADLRKIDRLQKDRKRLEQDRRKAVALFGDLWQGESSDWDGLEAYLAWVTEFRDICVQNGLKNEAIEHAATPHPSFADIDALHDAAASLDSALAAIEQLGGWRDEYFREQPLTDLASRLRAVMTRQSDAHAWASYGRAYRAALATAGTEVADMCHSGAVPFPAASGAFRRGYFARLIEQAMAEREALREFSTLTHEQRIARFRQLDRDVLSENRARIVNTIRRSVQSKLYSPELQDEVAYLQNQIGLTRKRPLLQIMQRAGSAMRAIKPCFMMSPMTVAQFLDIDRERFDVVIFDEASQLPTEDAVGAIVRGKQLVVAGDPLQLPPTNFFAVNAGLVSSEHDDESGPIYDDGESVLEVMVAAGFAKSQLAWHYRSKAESLITFNNVDVYDGALLTFPSSLLDSDRFGLSFVKVSGTYDKGGLNLAEARAVADAVVEHIKSRPTVSLGVGTFNLRQQLAILDELELRRRRDPSIEPFFDRGRNRPFFVKNLENIQGDEREAIFLSVTYGPAADGVVRQNFGPLNRENGWRRLNVLTSRAILQMKVFASMTGDDVRIVPDTEGQKSGPNLLRHFLHYAERRMIDRSVTTRGADADSPFEADVASAVASLGYEAVPQVGEAGYKIDLGVLDPSKPGRFLCGIECDGAAYHCAQTARDRDRLRQQVLEDRNWRIHRIWSTDWFRDREGQIERIRVKLAAFAAAPYEEPVERAPNPPAIDIAHTGESVKETLPVEPYVRPVSAVYEMAVVRPPHSGADLLSTPLELIANRVKAVIETEAPLHIRDIQLRLCAAWSTRGGSRIYSRIDVAIDEVAGAGSAQRRGEYIWPMSGAFAIRSRTGSGIPIERIPPEEVRATIELILAAGHGFTLDELTQETRAVLGYETTGSQIRASIGEAIESLVADGVIGQSSHGYAMMR